VRRLLRVSRVAERGSPKSDLWNHRGFSGREDVNPPGHWNQIAQDASALGGKSLEDSARLFALLNIALADAAISCWDAKYEYNLWRPVTAIRQADTDNNPNTTADPQWLPLVTTPPFPEYMSGHSTFSGAADAVMSSVFGSDFAMPIGAIDRSTVCEPTKTSAKRPRNRASAAFTEEFI